MACFNDLKIDEWTIDLDEAVRLHNEFSDRINVCGIRYVPTVDYSTTVTTCNDIIDCNVYPRIVYIHHTSCPNCGGLLDGNEDQPYTYCVHCGAKVWSEREVNAR